MEDFSKAEQILKQYNGLIIRICKRYASYNEQVEYQIDWEDLYQDCRLRFYEKWPDIQASNVKNMQSFITVLCRNCCYNAVRDTRIQIPKDLISISNLWKLGSKEKVKEDKHGSTEVH